MRRAAVVLLLGGALILAAGSRAFAQEPSRIGRFVLDIRGALPALPDEQSLAESRGLVPDELPGRALALDGGAHVYLFRWKSVTFGAGAQLTMMRASAAPPPSSGLRAVESRLTSFTPQVSLNFGTGEGWSYLSGGVGSTTWSIVPEGEAATAADEERLRAFNYGGGARWFINRHLAFTFDVRFHAVDAGTIYPGGRPGAPRTRLLVMSAGLSLK